LGRKLSEAKKWGIQKTLAVALLFLLSAFLFLPFAAL
jgi:hypothetical protein